MSTSNRSIRREFVDLAKLTLVRTSSKDEPTMTDIASSPNSSAFSAFLPRGLSHHRSSSSASASDRPTIPGAIDFSNNANISSSPSGLSVSPSVGSFSDTGGKWMSSLGMGGLKTRGVKPSFTFIGSGLVPAGEDSPGGILIKRTEAELETFNVYGRPTIRRAPSSSAISTNSSTRSSSAGPSPISERKSHSSRGEASPAPGSAEPRIRFAPLPETKRSRAYTTGQNLWFERQEEEDGALAGYHVVFRGNNGEVVKAEDLGDPNQAKAPKAVAINAAALTASHLAAVVTSTPSTGSAPDGFERGPPLFITTTGDTIGKTSSIPDRLPSARNSSSSGSGSLTSKLLMPLARPLGFRWDKRKNGDLTPGVPLVKSNSWHDTPRAWAGKVGSLSIRRSGSKDSADTSFPDENGESTPRRRIQYPPVAQRGRAAAAAAAGQIKRIDEPAFIEWGHLVSQPTPSSSVPAADDSTPPGHSHLAPPSRPTISTSASSPAVTLTAAAASADDEEDDGSGMAWARRRRLEREGKARLEDASADEAAGPTPAGSPSPPQLVLNPPTPQMTPASLLTEQLSFHPIGSSGPSTSKAAVAPVPTAKALEPVGESTPTPGSSADVSGDEEEDEDEEEEEEAEKDDDDDLDADELAEEARLCLEAKRTQGVAAAGKEVYRDHERHRMLLRAEERDSPDASRALSEKDRRPPTMRVLSSHAPTE